MGRFRQRGEFKKKPVLHVRWQSSRLTVTIPPSERADLLI